jgi:hypothetical protein
MSRILVSSLYSPNYGDAFIDRVAPNGDAKHPAKVSQALAERTGTGY